MTFSRRILMARLFVAGVVTALIDPREALAGTVQYTYDAQGRLTRVVYSNGVVVDYTYDNAGNRSQVVRNDGVSPPAPPPPPPPVVSGHLNATTWNWTKTGTAPPLVIPTFVVATPLGGVAPYTYSWQRVSGDASTTATAPSAVSTAWTRATTPLNVTNTSVWRCQITDSRSTSAFTPNVTVNIRRETAPGGG